MFDYDIQIEETRACEEAELLQELADELNADHEEENPPVVFDEEYIANEVDYTVAPF